MIITFTYKIDQDISLALPRPKLDAKPFLELIDRNRKELTKWLWSGTTEEEIGTIDEEEAFLSAVLQDFGRTKSLYLLIWYKNNLVGTTGFNQFNKINKSAELGYVLDTQFSGKGIIHKSILGLCSLGFTEYDIHKIEIYTAVDNQKSNKVAQKAGFHLDGVLREHELLQDGFHDDNVWSLLKDDWKAKR